LLKSVACCQFRSILKKVFWSLQSFDTPLSCLSDHRG